ncbi:MAG: hypothetical protein JXB38_11620 [Anaerolineales bacterium]|nr:hypothetical protein [Anaerolineales bacterium]
MKKYICLIGLLVLTACAGSTALPNVTEAPISAPTDSPVTNTPDVIEATPTPLPVETNTPQTSSPHLTVTPTETYTWRSESPDGSWTALGFLRGPLIMEGRDDYQLLFQIQDNDGALVWTVYDEYIPAALGFGLPEVYRWAEDENAVYLTHRTQVDGCGILVDGSDLLHFDLENGQLETLFLGEARAIGLSPDAGTLAYIPWGAAAPELVLLDLTSGVERRSTLEGFTDAPVAGAIVWAPDGRVLALTVAENACLEEWRHTILSLDVETLTSRILLTSDRRTDPALLSTSGWQDVDHLLLKDNGDQEWVYDLENEILMPVE